MSIKIKKQDIIPIAIFVIYTIAYLFLLIQYPMGTKEAQYRYFILGFGISGGILLLLKRKGFHLLGKVKYNDLLMVLIVGGLFFIESYFIAKANDMSLQFRTYVQIFLLMGPVLFAYCLLNLLNSKQILVCFKILFFISIGFYFIESGHTLIDFFDADKYTKLFSGHFFTESSLFSEIFLQMFLFFNYFCFINKSEDCAVPSAYVIVSGVFTVLCGKRLAILMVLIIPLINWYLKKNNRKRIGKIALYGTLITICAGTILYTNMLQHNVFPNFDIYKFSTGRDYILSLWEKHNYISYGYGSSLGIIGRYLELDLVEIYLELSLFCLTAFVYYFLRIGKNNQYGFIIIVYSLLNMLTASSLPYSMGLLLVILSVKTIEEKGKNQNEQM